MASEKECLQSKDRKLSTDAEQKDGKGWRVKLAQRKGEVE